MPFAFLPSFLKKSLITAMMTAALLGHPSFSSQASADDKAKPITEKVLLNHLEEITAWQRNILSIQTTPNNALEKLLKDTLQRSSSKVLQYGFEFARAQANILTSQQKEMVTVENPNDPRNQLSQSMNEITTRITAIQAEQAALAARLQRTPSRQRTPLLIQQEKLSGELKMANARQDLLKSLNKLVVNTEEDKSADDVLTKINNLSQTVPGAAKKKTKTTSEAEAAAAAATTAAATSAAVTAASTPADNTDAAAAAPAPASKSIIGTISDMVGIYRKKQDLSVLSAETTALHDDNRELINSLRDTLQQAVTRGNELTQTLNSVDKTTIENQRSQIDGLVDGFKQLSIVVVPLGKVNVWLEASQRDLDEWNGSLDDQLKQLTRTLLWQSLLLAMAVLIPLIISEAVRRAIRKYINDNKRQRQMHMVRRTVFVLVILLIVLLNFITEFSSLATFAGFLTAGLAVALQNVILSAVAHFFYFGRFGVRVGDRVTIKGFTGEVVQVGLIRLYMMELSGPETERYPTGKIVSFPNSILFQSEAFSKQITGADYSWQEVTFILDPTSDYELANKKLNEAVNKVYLQYQEVMENQKMAMTRSTHLNISMPAPRGFLNFVPEGLAFVIRYPIQTDHIAEINQRITQQIMETIANEPSLKLANSSPPKIEAVDVDDHPQPPESSSSSDDENL